MVRVILNGSNGKMGKVICNLAENYSNLEIVAGIDKGKSTSSFPVFTDINECNIEADVILDFSRPEALNGLLNFATSKNMPIIICTTGFSENQIKLIEETAKKIPVLDLLICL